MKFKVNTQTPYIRKVSGQIFARVFTLVENFDARSRDKWLWDAIIYPCLRYLVLAPRSPISITTDQCHSGMPRFLSLSEQGLSQWDKTLYTWIIDRKQAHDWCWEDTVKWHHVKRIYDNAMMWKRFPRYWPFVREIQRTPVDTHDKN